MRAYTIFDDFDSCAAAALRNAGIELTVHPQGVPRPSKEQMKEILGEYDCVIIGTSQKIGEDDFDAVNSPRIIATASAGTDHIKVPEAKKDLITVINTPGANAAAVAEYTLGCALSCVKRFDEGNALYRQGVDNKSLFAKPRELSGKVMGIFGAGKVSEAVAEYAAFFGMEVICFTPHPENHPETAKYVNEFVSPENLAEKADVISVNLPLNDGTRGIISRELIGRMKNDAVFISVSRAETADIPALFEKAKANRGFYVCLDIDVDKDLAKEVPPGYNISVTPHIAGGTAETRVRMFRQAAESIIERVKK